jgi:hypothetical protein
MTLLVGCGSSSDEPDPATPTPTESASGAPSGQSDSPDATQSPDRALQLDVSIQGDQVSPNSEEVDLARGETMTFVVTSDRAGEMHVHAKPEQYLEFGVGTTRLDLVIDTPGVVEVEDHETGNVVALIEVR